MPPRRLVAGAVAGALALTALAAGDRGVNVFIGNDTIPTPTATATSTPTPTATPTATPTPTPTPDPSVANLWVDTDGGSCTRASTAASYNTATACGTNPPCVTDVGCGAFDQAWNAASAGDTIRVKNGSYGIQFVTGNKASETKIVGESKAGVVVSGSLQDCHDAFGNSTVFCADGNNLTVENITIDSDAQGGASAGGKVYGDNVTYRNVDIVGEQPDIQVHGDNWTWTGGTYGDPNPPARTCNKAGGEPIWLFASGATVDRITFNKQTVQSGAGPNCGGDNIPHLEFMRLESSASNTTLSRSRFLPGSDAGSGYIFSSITGLTGFRVVGNYFADNAGTTWAQIGGITPALVAYNVFNDGATFGGTSSTVFVGNLGSPQGVCSGTHIKNVWTGTGSACGSDTFLGSTSIGVDSTGHLTGTSPAIDAGETPGASDHCTDTWVASVDFDGDTRPVGSVCDAGPDEYVP